ncbi:MAG: hypothetical protein IPH12_05905 [Saprospirales bacterium]|nr:hypothetical protein [Saprospirales bacterium]
MKNALFFSVLLFAACTKEPDVAPSTNDYFIFGTYYGECAGNCSHIFKLEGQNLFADDMEYLQPDDLVFQSQSLAPDKIALAAALEAQIPASLFDETAETIGCPDCHDQGGYLVKIKTGDTVRQWFIDRDVPKYAAFCDSIAATVQQLE